MSRRTLALILVLALLLAGGVIRMVFSGGERIRTLRAVQACVDPAIDEARSFGELLVAHPHLANPVWTAGWSDDDHLVAAELRLDRFDDLRRDHGLLVAPFLEQIARMPSWSGVAGDQPAVLEVVFRARPDPDGRLQVAIASLRITEVWVVFRPEAVESFEKTIETAIDNADDRTRARRYRLRHDGDRALFNAGLDGPMLAGPGSAHEARGAFTALVRWR